jgi:protein ImuB
VAGGKACGIRPGMPLAEATALGEGQGTRGKGQGWPGLDRREAPAARRPGLRLRLQPRPPDSLPPDPCSLPLLLLPYDPVADRAALEELALWCERFSPAVAIESAEHPDGLALDVTGLGPLFGGEAAMVERVVREFHERGLSVRIAIADTLGAAWAVAHFGGQSVGVPALAGGARCPLGPPAGRPPKGGTPTSDLRLSTSDPFSVSIVPSGTTFSALAPLPVAALRLPEETVALLAAVGIRTIEQVAALPRASLTARFGSQLLEQLDRAMGAANELLVPHRPAPEFSAAWEFESPTEHVEAIEQVLEELMRRVCVSLAARGEGALGFVCRIRCANRERIGLPIGLFRPSASAKHLGELLRLRLETIRLESPVSGLAIEVTAVAPLGQQQQELFIQDRCCEAPRHLAALVERLSSRLGREAVVRPALLPDAQPEYASVDLPWTGLERGRGSGVGGQRKQGGKRLGAGNWGLGIRTRKRPADRVPSPQPPVPSSLPLRPIWLADPPVPIAVISVVPSGPPAQFHFSGVDYRIARAWGPERIETGWWRKLGAGERAVMARSPDRARGALMTPTEGLPLQQKTGDLRSAKWHGRETMPQRGAGVRRDYYRVETTGGRRFWLFRRLTDARWFLHGGFG